MFFSLLVSYKSHLFKDETPLTEVNDDEDEAPRRLHRKLPEGTRKEILQYFDAAIASKKSPTTADCKKYVEERQSSLEWTRVKAIVNSHVQVNDSLGKYQISRTIWEQFSTLLY